MSPQIVALGGADQERDDHGRFGAASGEAKAATDAAWKADRAAPKIDDVAKGASGPAGVKAARAAEKAKTSVAKGHEDAAAKHRDASEKAAKIGNTAAMVHHSAEAAKHDNAARVAKHEAKEAKQMGKHAAGANARPALAFARFIVAGVDGAAPREARLWAAGWNDTDKGALNFTPDSARMVMQAYRDRGNPLAWYYEHENREPLSVRGGCPMKGVCSAPRSALEIRGPADAPECWASGIEWTAEAQRQITSGERTQLSPVAAFDSETREIVAILDVSLCAEGATHNGTLLASRNGKDTGTMDDLIQQILDALNAGDFETAETLVQQMEAQAPDAAMTKFARMAMAKAKPPAAAPPAPPTAPPVVAKQMTALAASKAPAGVDVEAFNRATTEMHAAIGEARAAAASSRRETVVAMLSRAIDMGMPLDGVDEREHIAGGDPDATRRFLASLGRKAKVGVLVASKAPALPANPANPKAPADKPVVVETFGLSPTEIAAAAQHGVTLEAYAKSAARVKSGDRRAITVESA